MSHTPTPEQAAIIAAAQTTPDNLIIRSLAGAAKTTTLVMIAEALPTVSILCLAFNKRIAVEMEKRLPSNCTSSTFNSICHRTWGDAIGKRLIVDKDKNYKILTAAIKALGKREQEDAYEMFAETLKALEQGKVNGYIPTDHFSNAKRLMGDEDFFASLEEAPTRLQERLLRECTLTSIKQAMAGTIDFSDQILMPTVFPSMFPHFPLVMVDEFQDLSELNHATLKKLAKKRLIAVGDECQSIYAFRGAHQNSMDLGKETFNMRPFTLSTSFRCPQAVVREARWRAPHMQWPDWAVEGQVRALQEWDEALVPQTAAIICRNNAPLFSIAIKLLKNGRYPQIIGNDIGKYLVKVMKKFGDTKMPRDQAHGSIDIWRDDKLRKTRNEGKVRDQEACLRIFVDTGDTLGDAIAYAEHLFNSQGPIQLMTGHKAKGLEFDVVFVLDQHLIRMDEQQDQNLRYVMQTRAKQSLYYVNSEDFHDD